MSKKSTFVQQILDAVQVRQPFPEQRDPSRTLVDEAALLVLLRHLTPAQAEASLAKLKQEYPDWNELRVSQAQEIGQHLKGGRGKKGVEHAAFNAAAAQELKDVLHEIFQKTHGMDLEFLREDVGKLSGPLLEGPLLGLTAASHLLYLAAGEDVPMHPGLAKFLDRLGIIARTSSMRKAREALDDVVPKDKLHQFTVVFHEILDLWEDEDQPSYERFPVLRTCPFGKKAYTDRVALLKRQESQRKRDDERRRREEERERKRLEAEEKKRQKQLELEEKRRQREAEKKARELERQRLIAEKAKEKARAEAERKKAAEAEKKAAEKERLRRKKEAERKKAAAKKAAEKKKATAKKTSKKKTTTKRPAKKAAKKKATKSATKKTAAKKATAKKTTTRKKTARRPARKA